MARMTLNDLRRKKAAGEPLTMLTAYDATTARLLAETGLEMLLVGDSAAMTLLGEDSTLPITLDFLLILTAAVRRGAPDIYLMADMPFGSYPEARSACEHGARFLREARADAVKLEVDRRHLPQVAAMAAMGIPVCAHLGLLPQRAEILGGYKAQGRTPEQAREIVAVSELMVEAGAVMLLLEAVPDEVTQQVKAAVGVPVLGCGAGPSCDGHVVVIHDLLGFNPRPPRFVDALVDVPALIRLAASSYLQSIRQRTYPAARHGYPMAK